MKTFKLAKTAVATLALCSGFAQAIPVTDWIVTDTASFLESSITPRNNGALPNTPNYPTLTTTATTETLACLLYTSRCV